MADPAHIITHHSAAQRLARAPLARFEISPHHTRRIIFCFNNIKLLNCETFFPFFFFYPSQFLRREKRRKKEFSACASRCRFLSFLSCLSSILSYRLAREGTIIYIRMGIDKKKISNLPKRNVRGSISERHHLLAPALAAVGMNVGTIN